MRARQTPTYEANVPGRLDGDGPNATSLAEAYFGEPMPWQPHLLDAMLARDGQDKFVLSEYGISVPRQNGKSWVVRARCFYGALTGERILYTCHHGDTSDEMFQELCAPFEDDDEQELRKKLLTIRKTNGKQAIVLRNGGLIRFITRTDKGGRGKSFDVLVVDEAQELTDSQQAALLPTTSAGKKKNPQTIYLGTPPDTKCLGTVFRSMRDEIMSGESSMAWSEWGVGEVGNKHDRTRWFEANPSLGMVLNLRSVESESNQMQAETFARERLGWWSPIGGSFELAIDSTKWAEAERGAAMESGKLAFGVKFSSDGSTVAVSWARAERGGGSYVELYDVSATASGTVGIADMLMRHSSEVAAVCIDGKSGADALVQRLIDGRFPKKAIIPGSAAVAQSAATMLRDEVNAGTLTHISSPALDASATGSVRREIGGNGGWGFGDGPTAKSVPIESASLALYAARTTKRDPSRVQDASY
nr:terminase family protein [uncultured Olsenella sp.]